MPPILSRMQAKTPVPAVSQIPVFFIGPPKQSNRASENRQEEYSSIMHEIAIQQKPVIPEDFVHITLEHAAVSFLHNSHFRTKLFRNSDVQIQGRSMRSQGYFEILRDGISKEGSVHKGKLFKSVNKHTFYNVLAPEERSFHLCSGVGHIYIDTDHLHADSRGLVVFTDPFRFTDSKVALVKKVDLEEVMRDTPATRKGKLLNGLMSAVRDYIQF